MIWSDQVNDALRLLMASDNHQAIAKEKRHVFLKACDEQQAGIRWKKLKFKLAWAAEEGIDLESLGWGQRVC